LRVDFDASASSTPEGTRLETYEWFFGDGGSAHGVKATHEYRLTGRYAARLTVTNHLGLCDSARLDVEVSPLRLGPFIRADANGDGAVNIADPSLSLNFLFLGGPEPSAPFPDCGRVEHAAPGCDAPLDGSCLRAVP
jgi:hypothetical protein